MFLLNILNLLDLIDAKYSLLIKKLCLLWLITIL